MPSSRRRLLADADVRSRIAELRQEIESSVLQLEIMKRDHRLLAIQDRWDSLRAAKDAFAAEDYEAAMATGVVTKRLRTIRTGKDEYQTVEEYEINSKLIECLNSVERRAAIETGPEVDRSDIKLRGAVNEGEELLKRAFTFEELAEMDARMRRAAAGQVVVAKALPSAETSTSGEVESGVTLSQSPKSPKSWRD